MAHISSPNLVSILRTSTDLLKQNTPLIIQSCKDVIDQPNDENALAKRKQFFAIVIDAISQGVSAVAQSANYLNSFDVEFFYPGI